MISNDIHRDYFYWLYNLVCGYRYAKEISYELLLKHMHKKEFKYVIPIDQNRAIDGCDLRWRFAVDMGPDVDPYLIEESLQGPCSVFEMMVALALRCEETIMDDPSMGDRTGQWFWGMIVSLGFGAMLNDRYDPGYVEYVLDKLINRDYEPDGRGGLFTIKDCEYDLRTVPISHQLCWYLDRIT